MINVFFGILLIFFKTNFSFVDVGVTYYITNIIGYITLFFGFSELARDNKRFNAIQPYVIFMLCHSVLFFLLNISGNSPLQIALTSNFLTLLSMGSLLFIIAGTFAIFYIISEFFKVLSDDSNAIHSVKQLENLYHAMLAFFLLGGISCFISQTATKFLTAISLFIVVLFLIKFYTVFLKRIKSLV